MDCLSSLFPKNSMKLSIIIPAYNEENTIREIISRVKKAELPKGIKKEIIVVDDASIDRTAEMLIKISGIKVFTHKVNRGKGAAVRTGIVNSSGGILIIQDADLEYNPKYFSKLLNPILREDKKVVYGTRLKNYPVRLTGKRKTPLLTHFLGNKLLSLVTSILYGVPVSDMETGYKVFLRSTLKGIKLNSKRFDFEPEITAKLLKKGIRIHEVAITVNPRGYDEGKKITWKDGLFAVWTLIKYKFND